MSDLDRVLSHIDADLDAALDRLFQTLRLRSISTDPAFAAETRACAAWHAADLAALAADLFAHGGAVAPDAVEPAYLRNQVALTIAGQQALRDARG